MLNSIDDEMGHLDLLLAGSLAIVVVSVYSIFDVLAAVSLDIRFNLITLASLLIVGAILLRNRSKQEKIWWALFAALVIFTISRIDWNTRKPFLRDLNSIEMGMSTDDVENIMAGYIQANDGANKPSSESSLSGDSSSSDTLVFRHTNLGWGDSDWGIVTFKEEKVVEVYFSPD
jgi:hypothetical protein